MKMNELSGQNPTDRYTFWQQAKHARLYVPTAFTLARL